MAMPLTIRGRETSDGGIIFGSNRVVTVGCARGVLGGLFGACADRERRGAEQASLPDAPDQEAGETRTTPGTSAA
jgi:hypothetical protein